MNSNPDTKPQFILSKAIDLVNDRKLVEATSTCKDLNKRYPGFAPGWHLASQLAQQRGNFARALETIDIALLLHPEISLWKMQKAACLIRLGDILEARSVAEKLLGKPFDSASQYSNFGVLLSKLELYHAALEQYRQATQLEPRIARNYFNLATAHRFLGNIVEAENALDEALNLNPVDGEAWKLRSDLRRQTPDDNHIPDLESIVRKDELPSGARVHLYYALGKELEDLERWPESFSALAKGADLRRRTMRYDVGDDLATMQQIVRHYPAKACKPTAQNSQGKGVIFVLGMPRTGTTVVERVLGSHSQVHAAGELPNFAKKMSSAVQQKLLIASASKLQRVKASISLDFNALGANYLKSTTNAASFAPHFVDKMPLNFLYVGLIHKALPLAKIIHVTRNPMDTCFAIFKTQFASAYPFSYDLEELARYFLGYRALMEHWKSVLPGIVHEVNYERLVSDHDSEVQQLLKYCGLGVEPQCLRFHENSAASTTASASQVRMPLYSSSIGRWRQFQQELEPLRKILIEGGMDI